MEPVTDWKPRPGRTCDQNPYPPTPSGHRVYESRPQRRRNTRIPEIAITGDLTEHESELTERLLDIEPGGQCTFYFDSPGGSPYCAVSLMTIIRLRGLRATGIVTGECSSAALWPFAACERRLVSPLASSCFIP